jgi:hypothetical protein
MTIEKGSPYGEPGSLPAGGVVASSDREARRELERARLEGRPLPAVGLTGGDLWHTLGGAGALNVRFPVDLGEVLIDGRLHYFVAHLVAHTRTWSYTFLAMNAQWLGSWNAGPRAHPGDAVLDTYEAKLGWSDRFKVRSRLAHGVHLPHPGIRERRAPAVQVSLPRSLPVLLDGEDVGEGRNLSVRLRPDALTVVV